MRAKKKIGYYERKVKGQKQALAEIDRKLEEVQNIAKQTPPMIGANDAWATWSGSSSRPAGAPGGQGPPGGGGGPPQGPPAGTASFNGNIGPVGNVASGKLFDDRVALDARYQFNGSKENGAQWRE